MQNHRLEAHSGKIWADSITKNTLKYLKTFSKYWSPSIWCKYSLKSRYTLYMVEGDASNLRLTKVRFPTLSSHFFANYIDIFYKT